MLSRDRGWIDNHCHLDDDRVPGGVDGVIAAAAGRRRDDDDHRRHRRGDARRRRSRSPRAHDDVWATVGLHPHDAEQRRRHDRRPLLDEPEVVAVGECGLDYHYDHSPRDVQRDAFAAQIALAHEHGLPLVIHTREAWDDTFDVLAAEGVPARTVFHCFTGGPDEARRCLDLGAYLSLQRHRHVQDAPTTCGRRPRCARSTACWSRPTARTSRPCRTAASRTSRRSSRMSCARLAELRGVDVDDGSRRYRGERLPCVPGHSSIAFCTVPRTGNHTMNPYDRRRLVLASIFTVAALPALWIINRR